MYDDLAVGRSSLIPGEVPRHVCIDLAQDYLTFAEQRLDSCTAPERMRFFLTFAMTLVHEMTHAICQSTAHADDTRILDSSFRGLGVAEEPFFCLGDAEDELGCAWEHWMFGGLLSTIGAYESLTAEHGLTWRPWRKMHFKQLRPASIGPVYELFVHNTWLRGLHQYEFEIGPPPSLCIHLVGSAAWKKEFDSYLGRRRSKDMNAAAKKKAQERCLNR